MGRIVKPAHGPEWYIQNKLKDFLRAREWLVEQTHGNLYQKGFPDLYVKHKRHGHRWIDCKQPKKFSLTRDQRLKWPIWHDYGIGIWILTAADQSEYDKLFAPPNWKDFWKPSYGDIPDIDTLLQELKDEAAKEEAELAMPRNVVRDGLRHSGRRAYGSDRSRWQQGSSSVHRRR
jgi:hypothetical protein